MSAGVTVEESTAEMAVDQPDSSDEQPIIDEDSILRVLASNLDFQSDTSNLLSCECALRIITKIIMVKMEVFSIIEAGADGL